MEDILLDFHEVKKLARQLVFSNVTFINLDRWQVSETCRPRHATV